MNSRHVTSSRRLQGGLSLFLLLAVFLGAFSGVACSDGDCTEQGCDKFGGSASRKLSSCVSSGTGAADDEFVLKDESDKEFYTCSRPADDNDKCGGELIRAKEAYCTK
jgi:hypothetical protein